MTVESAIHAWVVAGSGLAVDRVRWADQGSPDPANPGAWISLREIAETSGGQDWTTDAINPLVIADDAIESVDTATNTITLTAHGLLTGDGPVRFTTTGTLPAPLVPGVDYWIIRASANAVQLSEAFLGAVETPTPIDLTDAGTGTHTLSDVSGETLRAGAEVLTTTHGTRTGTLSIQCFGGAAVGVSSSAGILKRVKAAYRLPSIAAVLSAGGVGLGVLGVVRNVGAEKQRGTFEPRAVMEVTFHTAAVELTEAGTIIELAALTGAIAEPDGSETAVTGTIEIDPPAEPEVIALPDGFPWQPDFEIWRRGVRTYDVSISATSRTITPAITRYVSTTGNDANDGTSWLLAKRSIDNALGNFGGSALTLYVAAGDYRGTFGWNGRYLYNPTNIIGVGGKARFSISPAGLAWVANGTFPNVYQVTTPAPYAAIDEANPDVDGVATHLALQTSLANVNASPGSYYAAAGVLYVRTFDSRAPDASIHSFTTATNNGLVINNTNVYLQDVEFIGGSRAFMCQDANLVTGLRAGFHNGELDGYRADNVQDGMLVDCVTSGSWSGDGCSYSAIGNHLEVRCRHLRPGNAVPAVGTCNGSSAHGATIIQLSCTGVNSDGPNFAHVVNSWSLLAGCEMERCRATSELQQVNFAVDGFGGGSAKGYLLECLLSGPGGGIAHDLRPIDPDDRIYVRDTPYSGVSGDGQVLTW